MLNLKLNLFCMNGYTNNTIPKIKEDKNSDCIFARKFNENLDINKFNNIFNLYE